MSPTKSAQDNSMYLFRRPSFSESVAFSDTTDERMEHARRQQAEHAAFAKNMFFLKVFFVCSPP